MKSASSRPPLQRMPSVQTAPVRTAGPATSLNVGLVAVAFRLCAKCSVHVPTLPWSSAEDSSQAKSTMPPEPPVIVGKTTAPLPLLTLCIGDQVAPLSFETA